MNKKGSVQERCFHCGGILTLSGDDTFSCLMCGRESGHKCDMCMYAKAPKVAKATKVIKPKARKKRPVRQKATAR